MKQTRPKSETKDNGYLGVLSDHLRKLFGEYQNKKNSSFQFRLTTILINRTNHFVNFANYEQIQRKLE